MYKIKKFLLKNSGEAVVLEICFIFLWVAAAQKEGYHMDEMISYEFANSYYTPWIVPTQPEGRLETFMRREIVDSNFLVTVSNLAENLVDVVQNGSNSKALSYKAIVYDEPVWISRDRFTELMTTNQNKAFHFTSVYFNVKDDNHPPLHYMALHAVCSFFWKQISPVMGLIVNMIFVVLTIVMIMSISQNIAEICGFDNDKHAFAVTAGLLYGICAGTIATMLLIRMYAMLTFFCVALFGQHVKKWRISGFDRGNKLMIFIMIMGFLTHYYFVFYAGILAIINIIFLFKRGDKYSAKIYIRSVIIAAIIGLILFPFAVGDLLNSGRGVEATSNLIGGFAGLGERLAAFRKIIGTQTGIFGLMFMTLLWGAMAVIRILDKIIFPPKPDVNEPVHDSVNARDEIAKSREALKNYIEFKNEDDEAQKPEEVETDKVSKGKLGGAFKEKFSALPIGKLKATEEIKDTDYEKKRLEKEKKYRIVLGWLMTAPAVGYYLLAVKVSPYLVDRYIMAVYPFVALCCVFFIFTFWNIWQKDRSAVIWLYVTLIIVGGFQVMNHRFYDGEYLYKGYNTQLEFAKEHDKCPCICVYDGYGFYENCAEFLKYSSTLLVKADELADRKDTQMPDAPEGVVVIIKGDVDVDQVLLTMKNKYGYKPEGELVTNEAHGDRYGVFVK